MTSPAFGNHLSPQPIPRRVPFFGSDNNSIDVAPSALISSFIPHTPLDRGEGKNAMPSRAMVDMTSSRPAAAFAPARASRDWQRPVSWLPFAAESPFASVLLAGALVAGLSMAGGGVARADEAKAQPVSQSAKPQPQLPLNMPLLLAQNNVTGGPQVSLMQPAYADVLKGDTSIMVGIQPGRYNATSIELFVDDRSATGGPIPLTSSASTQFHWDTSKFVDGPHKLTVRVTDVQGFIGQTEVQVFVNNNKIQNTAPPTLSWINSPRGVLRGKVQLQLRAAGTFGVKFIMVSLNSAATPNVKPALATWFTNVPPYIISIDTTKYPDGLYVLSALGQNGLGEEGEAQMLKIGIANNTLSPTVIQDMLKPESEPGDTGVTGRTVEPPTFVSPPKASPVSAQVTAVTKQRDGAVEGTHRAPGGATSANSTRSDGTTEPRISEPGVSGGVLMQRGATSKVPSTTVNATKGGTTNNGQRVASSGTSAPKPPVVTTPPVLSVSPVTSKTAMNGGLASGTRENGVTASTPLTSTPNVVTRPLNGGSTHKVVPVTPANGGKTGSGLIAALPHRGPDDMQKREGATITVAPSNQTLKFPVSYRARKGETLQQVALRYGLPADILASVNEIGLSEPLADGQVVKLAQPLTVSYQGRPVVGDVSSMMMGNVAVTPFRFLFQKQGGTMTYDPIKHQVHAANATQEVTLTIGSDTALVNQKDVAMDLAAFLLSGRTMIPVRFFEKALHAQVEWTPATGRVYVAMTP